MLALYLSTDLFAKVCKIYDIPFYENSWSDREVKCSSIHEKKETFLRLV